jgi:hypothetical protein
LTARAKLEEPLGKMIQSHVAIDDFMNTMSLSGRRGMQCLKAMTL